MPIPKKIDLENMKQDIDDLELIVNSVEAQDVVTRLGKIHKSLTARMNDLQAQLDAKDATATTALGNMQTSVAAKEATAEADLVTYKGKLARYAAVNYKGDFVASTAYEANDVWKNPADNTLWIVPVDYTSGVTAQADIDAKSVRPHQDRDRVVSVDTIADMRLIGDRYHGMTVSVSGHTSIGIGGGEFVWMNGDFVEDIANDNVAYAIAASDDETGATGAFFKEFESVSVEDFGAIPGTTNSGAAFRLAGSYASLNGYSKVKLKYKKYTCDYLILYRGVIFEGELESITVIKQTSSILDKFVWSENFDDTVGTGAGVANNQLVPSWFGFKNVLIDGSAELDNLSSGVSFYGSAPVFENVVIANCGLDGLYSEYGTSTPAISGVVAQEEGYIKNLICRNNGRDGWVCNGPHNVYIDNYIGCFNGGWGFINGSNGDVYLGAPTYVSALHCFANHQGYDPNSGEPRKNIYIGTNISCGVLVVDGGFCEIASDNSLISILKQYLGGQGDNDAVRITGELNEIGVYSGIMRNDGVSNGKINGSACLRIQGNYNQIGVCRLKGTAIYNETGIIDRGFNGLVIEGDGNTVDNLQARDCVVGLSVSGSDNTVKGRITYAETAFDYDDTGGDNDIDLRVKMNPNFGGQSYASGSAPVAGSDRFSILAKGLPSGTKRTEYQVEIGGIDTTITTEQTLTIPHSLLYTPRRQDCSVILTGMTGTPPVVGFMRISACDADNVTVKFKFTSAGTGSCALALSAKVF